MDSPALVLADPSGVIQLWNDGAERLFGYPATEAVGQTLDLIVPETHREAHWAGFRAATREPTEDEETDRGAASVPVRLRDGSIARFAVRLLVLRDGLGQRTGALALFVPNAGPDEHEPPLPEL